MPLLVDIAEQCGWIVCVEHKSKQLQMETTFLSFTSSFTVCKCACFFLTFSFSLVQGYLQQHRIGKVKRTQAHIANDEAVLNGV